MEPRDCRDVAFQRRHADGRFPLQTMRQTDWHSPSTSTHFQTLMKLTNKQINRMCRDDWMFYRDPKAAPKPPRKTKRRAKR